MATGTNAIATREDANNKNPGVYTDDLKRCITFNSAGAAGLGVLNIDRYKSNPNRLVRYSDLIASTIIFQFVINVSSDASLYDKGPITLNTVGVADNSLIVAYARNTESTEIEQQDSEFSDASIPISPIDEVLQIAQDFEEQNYILGSDPSTTTPIDPSVEQPFDPITPPVDGSEDQVALIALTKGSNTSNLLGSTIYGPSTVLGNKTIKYTLYNKLYSTSDAGTYTLKYSGAKFLRNRDNVYPKGKITVSSSSSSQYQSITVNGPGMYTFNAYWKKSAVAGPIIPPTPTTYTFKLIFPLRGINFSILRIMFDCDIYTSNGTLIGSYSTPPAGVIYNHGEIPIDSVKTDNQTYYYMDLWAGNSIPYYVKVKSASFSYSASGAASGSSAVNVTWTGTNVTSRNERYTGSNPSIPITPGDPNVVGNYYALNPRTNIYSMEYDVASM